MQEQNQDKAHSIQVETYSRALFKLTLLFKIEKYVTLVRNSQVAMKVLKGKYAMSQKRR